MVLQVGVSSYSACLEASNWENYCRNEWIAYKNIVSHQSFIDFWWVLKTIVTIINTDLESRSILIYFFFIIWWPLNFTAVGLLKTIVDWNKRYCHHLLAIPLFLCRRRRIKAFFRKTSFCLIIRERDQIARWKKKTGLSQAFHSIYQLKNYWVRFLFSQEFCNIDVITICKFDSKIIRSDGEEDNLAFNDVVFTIEEKGPSALQKNTQSRYLELSLRLFLSNYNCCKQL